MCGIAGIAGNFSKEVLTSSLQAMGDAQRHRGPDDEGIQIFGSQGTIGLGSRRLAILDLSPEGHQPMTDPETGNAIVYNGELYNFPELKAELTAAGHTFRGRGDTEVMLHAYRHWGRPFLDRLRGMFAFVLWDEKERRVLIARDHAGIKPLYYSFIEDGFVCASEIDALLAGGLVDRTLDRRALAGYLAYGAVQEPLTILRSAESLAAGSWLEVDELGRELGRGRYWDIPEVEDSVAGDAVEQGRELLERAVGRHLLSDVPLGVFLSSGIDSTTVAGLAARASDSEVHAFTFSIPDHPSLDERPVAERSAARLGLVFHDVSVDAATALEWARTGLDAMDQPAADGLNTYMVSRAAREAGLTVALSGQGGDEVFGGYKSFRVVPRLLRLARATRWLPAGLRRGAAGLVTRSRGRVSSGKSRDLASAPPDIASVYLLFRRLLSGDEMHLLGVDAGRLGLSQSYLDTSAVPVGTAWRDGVAAVGRLESRFYLGNTLLRDGDVFGMANSLEIRVPLLDRDVMDWAFRIPSDVIQPRDKPAKHLLLEMCGDLLSNEQIGVPKRGFTLPIDSWLRGPLRGLRNEAIEALLDSGLVERAGVEAVSKAYAGDTYRSAWTRIWALVTLGHWLRTKSATVALP